MIIVKEDFVQSKEALNEDVQQLLVELDAGMKSKDYDLVDNLLKLHPTLINGISPRCEVPLVMAIKHWDWRLVEICINHGANPEERHLCSKDAKPKIPKLIAFEEFDKRIKGHQQDDVFEENYRMYTWILEKLLRYDPFEDIEEDLPEDR